MRQSAISKKALTLANAKCIIAGNTTATPLNNAQPWRFFIAYYGVVL